MKMAAKEPKSETLPVAIEEYAILKQSPEDLAAVLEVNLAGGNIGAFDLEGAHVPAGGATRWTRNNFETGEESEVDTIEGVVTYFRDQRKWYKIRYGEEGSTGNAPPDCQSQDNVHGIGIFEAGSEGNPTGLCSQCPNSQWKSDKRGGPGQDCAQIRMLFIHEKDGLLPMRVMVPPSSWADSRRYALGLANKGLPMYAVITRLTLYKDKSWNGITYSKIRFSYQRVSDEAKAKLRQVYEAMQRTLGTATIDVSDVKPQEANDATDNG
jgi:hypothetical protein